MKSNFTQLKKWTEQRCDAVDTKKENWGCWTVEAVNRAKMWMLTVVDTITAWRCKLCKRSLVKGFIFIYKFCFEVLVLPVFDGVAEWQKKFCILNFYDLIARRIENEDQNLFCEGFTGYHNSCLSFWKPKAITNLRWFL